MPLPAEQQVVQLLAGNEGILDSLDLNQVGPFSADLLTHFQNNHADVLAEIVTLGTLKKENLKQRTLDIISDFKATWSN